VAEYQFDPSKTQNTMLRDLALYLSSRNAMPKIEEKYLGDSLSGQFSNNTVFGGELPKNGVISLNYGAGEPTLAHEMTHAADNAMGNQYFEQTRPTGFFSAPPSNQFTRGYAKLQLGPSVNGRSSQNQYAGKLSSEDWAKKNLDYRSSSTELPAFGVGNMSGNPENKAPGHIDATMATEMAILLDLAKRNPGVKP
jgi:hypothetical protein